MGPSNGQVTVNDTPTKSKLFRFCEKKIDQWVRSQLRPGDSPIDDAGLPELPIEFRVAFTEESDNKQVSCVTEINLGGAVYRGCDLAQDTQQAFMQTLKRLHAH